ncbi:hypothetical protein [Natronomonas marina]|jgi:hypothetical protein|uniref:hypothetical protein n=1 Tax=Natronomonas marina TaxID=2961939 RepID=UPI0020C9CCE3|nr:hypothetical protein [Natronomonas marina]
MSRDRTRTRDRSSVEEVDATEFDVGLDDSDGRTDESASEPGGTERVGTRAKRVFSPRAFLAALLLSVGGLVAANAVVPLPGAGLVGVFAATFLFGLVAERRRYLETAVAGGVSFGASTLVGYAVVAALGGFGVPLAAVAGGVGCAVGALGHYFGRDLRDGLTREV